MLGVSAYSVDVAFVRFGTENLWGSWQFIRSQRKMRGRAIWEVEGIQQVDCRDSPVDNDQCRC